MRFVERVALLNEGANMPGVRAGSDVVDVRHMRRGQVLLQDDVCPLAAAARVLASR